MPPPQIPLVNRDGSDLNVNSLPSVGLKSAQECLPVTLNQGVDATQTYVPVAAFDSNNAATIVVVVAYNANRRFLKIINNGPGDVELWTKDKPDASKVNQSIRRGEVILANGGGLVENGERISAIYATANVATGLFVLEG